MVLEILSGHKAFRPTTPDPEDKRFFVRGRRFPQGFLTKCDTHYGSIEELNDLLGLNSKMRIIWTIRDPRDICLSKLRRGVTIEEGGDCDTPADDSTDDGCVDSIYKMFEMYRFIVSKFPERVYLIKMEDVLSKLEEEVCSLASFLKMDFEPAMLDFPNRMRNTKKKERYGERIDQSQLQLWKDAETVYGGFFVGQGSRLKRLFERVDLITRYFNYTD